MNRLEEILLKKTPLTFKKCIELTEHGEQSINCRLMLNGCYSQKDIYFETEKKIEVFNYISESYEKLTEKQFNKWYGNNLYFSDFN